MRIYRFAGSRGYAARNSRARTHLNCDERDAEARLRRAARGPALLRRGGRLLRQRDRRRAGAARSNARQRKREKRQPVVIQVTWNLSWAANKIISLNEIH